MIRHLKRAFSSMHMNLLHPEESPEVFNPAKQTLPSFFQAYMKSVQESKWGRIRMKKSILLSMIEHSKSQEDLDAILNAYYNFLGHKNGLSNILVDQILKLALFVDTPFKIFHLLENHRLLGYYPSLPVLESLVLRTCAEHPDRVEELAKILSTRDWLPKSKLIYETLFSSLKSLQAKELICDLYGSIPDLGQIDLSEEVSLTIIEAIADDVYREEVLFDYFVQNTKRGSLALDKSIQEARQSLEKEISQRQDGLNLTEAEPAEEKTEASEEQSQEEGDQ